jgi:hypothetical protein
VQCPDSAIPGLVNSVEEVIDTAIRVAGETRPVDRVRQVSKHLAREARKVMAAVPFHTFGEVLATAYRNVADRLGWEPERRAQLEEEFAAVHPGSRSSRSPGRRPSSTCRRAARRARAGSSPSP